MNYWIDKIQYCSMLLWFVCFRCVTTHCGCIFHSPVAGFSLLVFEVSLSSHNDAPQSIGLLWTSDQLVAETSTWQHTTLTTDRHPCPPGGIRTYGLSRRATVELCLRPRGHWDQQETICRMNFISSIISCHCFRWVFTIELMPSIFQFTKPCVNAVIEISAIVPIVPSRNIWSLFPSQGSKEHR